MGKIRKQNMTRLLSKKWEKLKVMPKRAKPLKLPDMQKMLRLI